MNNLINFSGLEDIIRTAIKLSIFTAKEIADYLGIKASTYFRKEILDILVRNGFLIESKEGKTSEYLSDREKVFTV